MDRKIVELLISGAGVNSISRTLHVSKRRIRRLREQAKEYGCLTEQGSKGPVELASYPEAVFPEPLDARSLKVSEAHDLLEAHRSWIEERLRAGWHAVTVFEELPVSVSRSSFYRYLERLKLNRLGESTRRVVPEIVHRAGEALLVDWGKLRDVTEAGSKKTLWMFVGVLGFSRYLLVRLVWRFDVETILKAMESMLRELGGIPQRITVDNPKCIALRASLYEPLLNPLVGALCRSLRGYL
ncbi:MAG: transposase [Deltaproteobacteria bacterium]|nr:transposase [Deltaproteobacteria bacterium]